MHNIYINGLQNNSMERRELAHIFVAILLMFIVAGLGFIIDGDAEKISQVFVFSFFVVGLPVFVKKAVAYLLDSSVEHKIWSVYYFGVRDKDHFKKEQPFGIILPLLLSAFSLGVVKCMTFLSYETSALKHRAAKRFGYYSYTEMTDWHNGLIGATGIVSLFFLGFISYLAGFEYLTKMAVYYAFFNILPVSNLDGTQIFFGSRIIWTVLAAVSLIFALYGFAL